jgi:hypothetical protein
VSTASTFWFVISCACIGHCYLRYPLKLRGHYFNTLTYFLDKDAKEELLAVGVPAETETPAETVH